MELLDLQTSDIISNAIQKLNAFTNLTFLSPGSKARMLVDILSEEIGLQALDFDANSGAALLRNASGNVLDFIGEIYGLDRLEEVRSSISNAEENFILYTTGANFGSINNGQDIVIPSGAMQISNQESLGSNSVIYVNTEDIVLRSTESRIYFSAQASNSGRNSNTGSNILNFHNFTNYADSLSRSLLVTNNHGISYGRDRESDDNFRYRIQKEKISSEAANETSLRLGLLVIPGVADALPIRYARGIGTCDWLITSSSVIVSEDLITLCQEVIDERQGVGMSNLARSPILIGAEFSFSVSYKGKIEDRQKESIKNTIRNSVADYVNNLDIGEALILDQIVRIVLTSSDLIESMGDVDSSDNFKNIYLYKRSAFSNSLTRKSLTGNYTPKNYERVVLETTIAKPITIIDNN
jgi:uncharacterized phage protein gp47/JayE